MSNEECDVLVAVSAEPGRRMMLSSMTPRNRDIARRLCREGGPLVAFVGEWVGLTDRGYDDMILHRANNF